MKKYLLIIALVAISIGSVSAQVVWGARVGFSKPTMTVSSGDSWDGNFGFEGGPVLYYSLKDNWYINSGLQVSFKKFTDEGDGWKDEFSMIYADIPIYAGYAFKVGNASLYAQAGPYIGVKLTEKWTWDDDYYGGGTEPSNNMSPINMGLGVMLGINIQKFKIEAGYQNGLTNILKDTEGDFSIKINSIFLGVSYIF